jgi:His-Xaa-Ser system protein HxsD
MTAGIQQIHGVAPSVWDTADCISLEADTTIYPIPAAIATGYKFSHRASVWLQPSLHVGRYHICIKPKPAVADRSDLVDAFINELLDQTLRQQLNQQFGPLRTLITAQAFAEGNLLDAVSEAPDAGAK